ncbi:hypothetical protein CBF27_10300 [Vagococcus acidifermentans]|uniref:Uncharacterized protein n=1 Tax=Vagococcus acidifermentans TaxID=564710 RepID=A0A430ARL8_9ENTE|nr:hypothetical protein CBF27_10300 [Vagococcus acidifermentans]
MFLWLKTLYRKRAVTWPFIFYTIIWTLSEKQLLNLIYIVGTLWYPLFNAGNSSKIMGVPNDLSQPGGGFAR